MYRLAFELFGNKFPKLEHFLCLTFLKHIIVEFENYKMKKKNLQPELSSLVKCLPIEEMNHNWDECKCCS